MKKMIVLIGLLMSVSAFSGEIVRMPMLDFLQTQEMDGVFEIKTTKFDKVLLDCQSLRMGLSFSNEGVMTSDVYLNEGMCYELYDFFYMSKEEKLPVCIGLDSEYQEIYISRDEGEDCN